MVFNIFNKFAVIFVFNNNSMFILMIKINSKTMHKMLRISRMSISLF